jgi:hypothetical protein
MYVSVRLWRRLTRRDGVVSQLSAPDLLTTDDFCIETKSLNDPLDLTNASHFVITINDTDIIYFVDGHEYLKVLWPTTTLI